MKLLLAIALFCVSLGNAAPITEKEKTEPKKNKEDGEKTIENKNLHSVKKWKMTVQYTNGTIISKTIVVPENSGLSALETAFAEADKYLKNKNKVKEYSISPIPTNYVLLAGD